MNGIQYLIRLDDACPTMNREKWGRMEKLLDSYSIKPMVGVIPHNEDQEQLINHECGDFWNAVISWVDKGWAIAMHGYNHCYMSMGGLNGLNPMWQRSEFAGLPLLQQREKIKSGIKIFHDQGINPNYFFAPSHTFDENTIIALREESDIRIISDTIARGPYKYKDFVIIPQIGGHCVKMRFPGVYTFCFHPNVMSNESFEALDIFISKYKSQFVSFEDLDLKNCKEKSTIDKLLSFAYFTYRRIRKIS